MRRAKRSSRSSTTTTGASNGTRCSARRACSAERRRPASAFFEGLGATIRHEPLGPGRSRTTYVYSFRARPRWLAPLLEPLIAALITREIRARLDSLRELLEQPR